jgi:apolipoprotein N-acyltransferase
VDRVKDENGADIFVRGVLTGSIMPQNTHTVYTRYGNWLVWISFFVSSMILLTAAFRKLHEAR